MPNCLKISIVTPCRNSIEFLRETVDSVLSQCYPNIEYIIIDGDSNDGTIDVIKSYSRSLAVWQSEPDNGMYDAISQGFAKSSGEIMGWINSDDKLLPWSLKVISEIFEQHPDVDWISSRFPLWWSADGNCRGAGRTRIASSLTIRAGWHFPDGKMNLGFLQQESTFWRRRLWEKTGGLRDSLRLAGDADLWFRMAKEAELWLVETPLAGFRYHPAQATNNSFSKYIVELKSSCPVTTTGLPFIYRHPGLCSRIAKVLPFDRFSSSLTRIPVNVLRCEDLRATNPTWIKQTDHEKLFA